MGFEKTKDGDRPNAEHGFENSEIDLENDALEQLQTVKARRRTNKSTVEVKTGMKRDRMGRRGYDENDDSADESAMLAPDRPIRIAGGGHHQAAQRTQPFMSENSEFGELFSGADDDDSMPSGLGSERYRRLDALAYNEKEDGDGAQFDHIFGDESAAPMVHHGENMVMELMRERDLEDKNRREAEQRAAQQKADGEVKPRFARRERTESRDRVENREEAVPPRGAGDGRTMDNNHVLVNSIQNEIENEEQPTHGEPVFSEPEAAYPAPMPYGYPQPQMPYGYPQQPYGYPPMPYGYPQQPYGYPPMPYGYPQQPYGYPPMPYGYPPMPYGYPQQPYGYPQMPEQGADMQRRPNPDRRRADEDRPQRPVTFLPMEIPEVEPEQPVIEEKPVRQEPAAEQPQEAAPRFNRRSRSAVPEQSADEAPAPMPAPAPVPEEPTAEEMMPSGFKRRSGRGDSKPRPMPEIPDEPEEPKFTRRSRNAPMDAAELSMPSGLSFDEDEPAERSGSRFSRRRHNGAPE